MEEVEYVRSLVEWINADDPRGEVVEGHTVSWIEERKKLEEMVRKWLEEGAGDEGR